MLYRKIISLTFGLLLVAGFSHCERPEAYEDKTDGGVEYGENTQAKGYEDPSPFTPDSNARVSGENQVDTSYDINDPRRYTEFDGTWPEDTDAERNHDDDEVDVEPMRKKEMEEYNQED